ncbi:MAG TPA: phosphomethylpyrimidine synthase [Elusimicrobia bacterium]|nr:MAG: phosphomethylpyrimidine synthase [Elusimicrobia bacterium RIFOXYD2_FULL_34_30]HAM38801.1 phosphomethylpyrimidine synthase [Elusimicrobiota bacterium]
MTQIESAKKNIITKEMQSVAKYENVPSKYIRDGIVKGTIVILKNNLRKNDTKFRIVGIGKGLKIKVNANIGTSPLNVNQKYEEQKVLISIKYGADVIMDLSTGGNIQKIRKMVIGISKLPVGTVPIYGLICDLASKGKKFINATPKQMFEEVEKQLSDGIDFVTIHCGLNLKALNILKKKKRLVGIVSRGGSFIAEWMSHNKKENPFYEYYDDLVKLVKKYDAVISLGDGLRPGCIADNTDEAQIAELKTLGELQQYAFRRNVMTMIEGPGHIPINNIEKNIKLQKKYCHNAPFYVLGPLTTDIAPGYDHITSAIGGALAGYFGADFLCYVTPAEHLSLPNIDDVKNGIIASRIAAHSAEIARGYKDSLKIDYELSKARKNFDWKKQKELALDPFEFERRLSAKSKDVCSMCGEFCAMKRKI